MTTHTAQLDATVLALRREFDDSFASAPRSATQPLQSLLAIRLGGDPYAIRVCEIGGLHADRRVTPLPTDVPELLGVTGFRGLIAPVYDLAAMCGYARANAPRWLVLLQQREPLALAFETFEMHFSVAPQSIVAAQVGDSAAPGTMARQPMADAVHHGGCVRPIVQLPSLLANMAQRRALPIQQRSLSS